MLFASFAVLAAVLPALAGHAQLPHARHRHLAARHGQAEKASLGARAQVAHGDAHRAIKRTVNKRGQQCRPRNQATQAAPSFAVTTSSAVSSSTPAPSSTPSSAPAPSSASETWSEAWSEAWSEPSSAAAPSSAWTALSSAAPAPAPAPSPATNNEGNAGSSSHWGVLAVTDQTCGWSNADDHHPNGAQDWLNCGIENGGWSPPHVSIDQLIAAELDDHGVFSPCQAYIEKFKQYGAEFNVYPIMLASFAMQESTCNPAVTGGGGEAGLMQIAPPNCESWANCWDVDYNIRRGAQLFRQMIDANGGNVLAAIGAYNGWRKGMTVGDATAARWSGHCRNQNNLDYIFQYCNGWMQNKNAYSMGKYFNLKDC